jgi:hypothetical protein
MSYKCYHTVGRVRTVFGESFVSNERVKEKVIGSLIKLDFNVVLDEGLNCSFSVDGKDEDFGFERVKVFIISHCSEDSLDLRICKSFTKLDESVFRESVVICNYT